MDSTEQLENQIAPQKMDLWLVDDNPEICETYASILEDDFKVTTFLSADSALQTLSEAVKSRLPDAILSDIAMPGRDGLTFASETLSITRDVTFMLMSGSADRETFRRALEIGVAGLLEKPFDCNAVVQIIRRAVLHRVHGQISEKIQGQMSSLLSTSEKLLSEYLNRYVEAENKLFENPEYWVHKDPNVRRNFVETLYKQNFLERDKEKGVEALKHLLEKKKLIDLFIERIDRKFLK